MGLFSWLRRNPAPKKPAPAAPTNKAGAKKAGESRDELIRKAAQIHAEKRKEFDKLDPAVREKLMRQAMAKKDPDAV